MKQVLVFFDTETTGTNPNRHSIHKLSGMVEVDGKVVEKFDFKLKPHPKAEVTSEALAVGRVTEKQIMAYPPYENAYAGFLKMMSKYIDRYNKVDKAWLVGFNNRSFDDVFLRKLFYLCKDEFFGAWFWSDSLDVMVLASQYLMDRRRVMSSFKLVRVAMELGIEVDETKLHDSNYDAYLTREIYRIVTGLKIEL